MHRIVPRGYFLSSLDTIFQVCLSPAAVRLFFLLEDIFIVLIYLDWKLFNFSLECFISFTSLQIFKTMFEYSPQVPFNSQPSMLQ